MSLAEQASQAAAVAALLDCEHRTRVLAWAVGALRERRIGKPQSVELTRCVGEFTKLANVQLEYAKAVGAKRPVYTGPMPSVAGLLALLEQNRIDAALRESAQLRAEVATILVEARRRLHQARSD
jgi:hypothetical protein